MRNEKKGNREVGVRKGIWDVHVDGAPSVMEGRDDKPHDRGWEKSHNPKDGVKARRGAISMLGCTRACVRGLSEA